MHIHDTRDDITIFRARAANVEMDHFSGGRDQRLLTAAHYSRTYS